MMLCFTVPTLTNFTGFTRHIVGIPKSESDNVLQFLFAQITENPDFQVRYKWETDDIAFWDNRVSVI